MVERRADAYVFIQDGGTALFAPDHSGRTNLFGAGLAAPVGPVEFDGLRPGRLETALPGAALHSVGVGRDLLPELFVVIGVGIAHVGVDMGRERDRDGPVEGRDGIFHDAQFTARQREETDSLDGHLRAVFQYDPHAARQHRAAHIHFAVKGLYLSGGKVERFAVDGDIDPDPESRVQDLGEILRIAVLPPPYAGFVGIVDPADVVALQRGARIALLEIGPAAHHTVAQREKRFGGLYPRGVETILDQAPGIGFYKLVHSRFIFSSIPSSARQSRTRAGEISRSPQSVFQT